jgi:hypothetical protein
MLLKSIYWLITGQFGNISAVYGAFKDFIGGRMGKIEHSYYGR